MTDRYAGLAGATVGIDGDRVVLDLSYSDSRRVDRFRFEVHSAVELADELLAAVDRIDGRL